MEGAESESARVDVGLQSGQSLALRMPESARSDLLEALARPELGWHTVTTDDSELTIDLRQVSYVRVQTGERRLGF
jgi:hypothetical protein